MRLKPDHLREGAVLVAICFILWLTMPRLMLCILLGVCAVVRSVCDPTSGVFRRVVSLLSLAAVGCSMLIIGAVTRHVVSKIIGRAVHHDRGL